MWPVCGRLTRAPWSSSRSLGSMPLQASSCPPTRWPPTVVSPADRGHVRLAGGLGPPRAVLALDWPRTVELQDVGWQM
eukprot:7851082-Pyramimonas_sp.AAC.1